MPRHRASAERPKQSSAAKPSTPQNRRYHQSEQITLVNLLTGLAADCQGQLLVDFVELTSNDKAGGIGNGFGKASPSYPP